MVILDKKGELIESPDYELGHVEQKEKKVTHTYVIDTEEEGHWEVAREYPNGGQDVDWAVDVPEEGHWETRGDDGEIVEHYDGIIPDDWPKEQPVSDVWLYGLYIEYTPEELDEMARQKAEAAAIQARSAQMQAATMFFVMASAPDMSDEDAQGMSTLFPEWQVGASYKTRDICRYRGALYRVLQDVPGAQTEHTPDKATSLYKRIGEPVGGVFPWVQPLGATDAYNKGDKVLHEGRTWVSDIDANVWEPGVYGWSEQGGAPGPGPGPEPEPEPEEWPAWRQPAGGHDAYPKGAKVSHKGGRWTSDVDANVWEPGVYGWTAKE